MKDGYDTVEWLAKQKWSTGKIGTFGGSQAGYAQNFLAVTQPPHLVAQYIIDGGLSLFHLGYRLGGITRVERFKEGMLGDARNPAEGPQPIDYPARKQREPGYLFAQTALIVAATYIPTVAKYFPVAFRDDRQKHIYAIWTSPW